ncbi:MAG: hypothetical protein ACE5GV_14320 [Candidatus Scalindua sp.]
MAKIEITVPDKLSKIDPELQERLLVGAIREVASAQLKEKEVDMEEAKKNILQFENKYHKCFADFEKEFPKDTGHGLHEDLVEWSFWNNIFEKTQKLIKDLKFVLGKTDEGNP